MNTKNNSVKLLNKKEHLSCQNDEKHDGFSVNYLEFNKNESKECKILKNCVFLILKGSGLISFGQNINKLIKTGNIVLLPGETEIVATIEKNTAVLLFYLPLSFSFCDHVSLETLSHEIPKKKKNDSQMQILEANKYIDNFVHSLLPPWKDGLQCNSFSQLKTKEFLLLLLNYTTREDLAAFFAPIITNDMGFYALIQENYRSVKTVKELAKLTDYSLAGFEKRFKRVFGMPAYQWMKKQMSNDLYHEICHSKKSFMVISHNFGFSSSAHLTNFCKSVFGLTPKAIRKGEIKPETDGNEAN
jgi:AraC-like DNA-binding protein